MSVKKGKKEWVVKKPVNAFKILYWECYFLPSIALKVKFYTLKQFRKETQGADKIIVSI